MSPPLHPSVRARRDGRQPPRWTHVAPLSESIDVPSVTPETQLHCPAAGRAPPGERVRVQGAPGTGAGGHAEGQGASSAVRRRLAPGELRGLRLPAGLRVAGAAAARPSFHARASATGKRYRYRFSWGGATAPRTFHLGPGIPDWNRARAALDGLSGLPHLGGLASPARGRKPAPPLEDWNLEAAAQSAE